MDCFLYDRVLRHERAGKKGCASNTNYPYFRRKRPKVFRRICRKDMHITLLEINSVTISIVDISQLTLRQLTDLNFKQLIKITSVLDVTQMSVLVLITVSTCRGTSWTQSSSKTKIFNGFSLTLLTIFTESSIANFEGS